jgi:tetratricopeptide (TPR) repeat protein
MQNNIFSPKVDSVNRDKLRGYLQTSAKMLLVLVFSLLPIFFIPNIFTSLNFTKTYFVIVGVLVAVILLSLSMLRSGTIKLFFPPTLAIFWLFALMGLASALLSGDKADALYGNMLEVHTAGFFVLMALIMTVSLTFASSKSAIVRLFIGLGISAFVLQFVHIFRLLFGPDFMAFGMFTTNTSSVFGSFNDLALFSGLIIIATIIVIQQISIKLTGKIIAGLLIGSSLVLLSVINFYIVWLAVGFVSLVTLLYSLSKDMWLREDEEQHKPVSKTVLGMLITVCVFSGAFIISGEYLGTVVGEATGVSHLEVRPSLDATLDIGSSVYSQDVLFGVGPNHFEDAWRLYKDPIINETLFWNTNFSAGSSFVSTLFVTTGIAGSILFVLFILGLLYTGYRSVSSAKTSDNIWYLIATVSFVVTIYLWFMTFVYVPGTVVMFLAALMTGLMLAVYCSVVSGIGATINISSSRQYGLFMIASVLVIVVVAGSSFFSVTKKYMSQVTYADAVRGFQNGASLLETDKLLIKAQDLNEQDIFVAERARLRLVELNRLNSLPEPSPTDQQNFQAALVDGIGLAERAVLIDSTNPFNHVLLASFYGLLNPEQYEGVKERRENSINTARKLDPTNPEYMILSAQLSARFGDLESARININEALKLKPNYTTALFLLTQIDIQEGNTESAINNTRAIISIEPSNPTRYFQLGVLLSTAKELKSAIQAFEAAVILDNNYANARYFLALAYLDDDREQDALNELKMVEVSNPDNENLKALIEQVEGGEFKKPESEFGVPVEDSGAVSQQDDVTTTSEEPETDLVKSLNQGDVRGQTEVLIETTTTENYKKRVESEEAQ